MADPAHSASASSESSHSETASLSSPESSIARNNPLASLLQQRKAGLLTHDEMIRSFQNFTSGEAGGGARQEQGRTEDGPVEEGSLQGGSAEEGSMEEGSTEEEPLGKISAEGGSMEEGSTEEEPLEEASAEVPAAVSGPDTAAVLRRQQRQRLLMSRFYGSLHGGTEYDGFDPDSDSDSSSDGATGLGRRNGSSVRSTRAIAAEDRQPVEPSGSTRQKLSKTKSQQQLRKRQQRQTRLHSAETKSAKLKQQDRYLPPSWSAALASPASTPGAAGKKTAGPRKAKQPRGLKKSATKSVPRATGRKRNTRQRPAGTKAPKGRGQQPSAEAVKGIERLHDFEMWKRKEKRLEALAKIRQDERVAQGKVRQNMVGYKRWKEKQKGNCGALPSSAEHGDSMFRYATSSVQRQRTERTRARLAEEEAQMGTPKLTPNSLKMAEQLQREGRRPKLEDQTRTVAWPARKDRLEREAAEREAAFEALTASPTPSPGTAVIIKQQRARDEWESDGGLSDRLVAYAPRWRERAEARRQAAVDAAKTLANRTCRTQPASSDTELEDMKARLTALAIPRTPAMGRTDEEEGSPTKRASVRRLHELAQPTLPRVKQNATSDTEGDHDSGSPQKLVPKRPSAQVLAMRRRTPATADTGDRDGSLPSSRQSWPEWAEAELVLSTLPSGRSASARLEFERASRAELPDVVHRWEALHESAAAEVADLCNDLAKTVEHVPADQRERIRASLEEMSETNRADAMQKIAMIDEEGLPTRAEGTIEETDGTPCPADRQVASGGESAGSGAPVDAGVDGRYPAAATHEPAPEPAASDDDVPRISNDEELMIATAAAAAAMAGAARASAGKNKSSKPRKPRKAGTGKKDSKGNKDDSSLRRRTVFSGKR